MGLDMRLYRKQYTEPEEWINVEKDGEKYTIMAEHNTLFQEEIGYWRKANHIHAWFVDNVQEGEDECREFEVTRYQLAKLLDTVRKVSKASVLIPGLVSTGYTVEDGKRTEITEDGKVIANPNVAKKLLPRAKGFFFGGEDYDEDYVSSLVDTMRILNMALASNIDVKFTYQSNW